MDVMIGIIYKAVMENDVELIKKLFDSHHISLNDVSDKKHNERFLFCAVEQNYQDMVKFLVENGANVNSCETVDMSPVLLAISLGNVKMTELLIDLGANIDAGLLNQKVVYPLHFAVSGMHLEIVLLLLSKGANIHAKDVFKDETALNLVSNFDYVYSSEEDKKHKMKIQVEIAKALLDKGAAVDSMNCIGLTPVECALNKRNTELCKLLFLEGASIKKIKSDGTYFEYLKFAVLYPSAQLTRLCLERGCDFRYRVEGSKSPYHDALLFSKPDVVKVFFEYGCPFDLPAFVEGTENVLFIFPNFETFPVLVIQQKFIEGIKNNSLQLVKAALSEEAEPKGCSMDVPSTLHYVAANGNHELIELLLKRGVPVNRNIEGETPLFIAVQNKNVQASEILLKFGACIYFEKRNSLKEVFENCKKLKTLFEAINNCFKLVKQGNNKVLNIVHSYNLSNGNNKMLSVLMNCVNRKGHSLMAMALQMGHTEIAENLMKLRIEKL